MTQQYWYFYVRLYCIFIDKTTGKRKHKQADILVQRGQNFKRRFLEVVCMVESAR